MATWLEAWDVAILRWVNRGWSHPVLDAAFAVVTNRWFLVALGIVLVAALVVRGRGRGRFVAAFVGAAGLADVLSSHVLKGLVARPRPCVALADVLVPLGASTSFSFPSSHASTAAAAAVVLVAAEPRGAPLFVAIALLSGLSRIYLGLHYPSDVAGGFVLGALLGLAAARLARVGPYFSDGRSKATQGESNPPLR